MRRLLLCLLLTLPVLAHADWQLNDKLSRLTFISTKAHHVGEVHRFQRLSGAVSGAGDATLEIDLASVDTGIAIRDDRMREMLFETNLYPLATLSTNVALEDLEKLHSGRSVASAQEITVNLHGQQQVVTTEMLITRLTPHRFLVTSTQPVVIQASQFGLVAGLEKLREIVGLPAISHAVPVSFQLVFDKQMPQ